MQPCTLVSVCMLESVRWEYPSRIIAVREEKKKKTIVRWECLGRVGMRNEAVAGRCFRVKRGKREGREEKEADGRTGDA